MWQKRREEFLARIDCDIESMGKHMRCVFPHNALDPSRFAESTVSLYPSFSLFLGVLIALAAACSSQPEIPDQDAAIAYDSLSTEAGTTSKSGAASSDQAISQQGVPPGGGAAGVLVATGPVAVIGSEPITAAEFNEEVEKLMATNLPAEVMAKIQGGRRDQLKQKLVESMVHRRLVERELEKNPVPVGEAAVETRIKEMREELEFAKLQSKAQFGSLEEMMQAMGMDQDQLRDSVRRSLALEEIVKKAHPYKEATKEEAKGLYEENLEFFKRPEQVHARHILLPVPEGSDEQTWEQTLARMLDIRAAVVDAKTQSFEQAAKEFSQDGSAPQGGSLGFFPRKVMVPEFEAVAFSLPPGQVSQPVRTQFGWHLIKVEEHQQAGTIPFESIEEQLARQLTTRRFQQAFAKYVEGVQAAASVEMKLENIE